MAWAIQKEEGIELIRAVPPGWELHSGGSDSPAIPRQVSGPPLADFHGGLLYFPQERGGVVEMRGPGEFLLHRGLGVPALVYTGRGLMAFRSGSGTKFGGYRLMEDGVVTNLAVTWIRALFPVAFEEDGSMLCLASDGAVWIAPDGSGTFRVTREVRTGFQGNPIRFLGRSERELFYITDRDLLAALPLHTP